MGTVNVMLAPAGSGGLQVFASRHRTENVTSSGTAAQSTKKANQADFFRVVADVDVYLKFGASPVAAVGDIFLPAGTAFECAAELNDVVSVIDA